MLWGARVLLPVVVLLTHVPATAAPVHDGALPPWQIFVVTTDVSGPSQQANIALNYCCDQAGMQPIVAPARWQTWVFFSAMDASDLRLGRVDTARQRPARQLHDGNIFRF